MPSYDLYLWIQQSRVKYPRSLNVPDVEAAHGIALRMARIFAETSPSRGEAWKEPCDHFVVEVVDEAGQAILIVPGRWMGSHSPRHPVESQLPFTVHTS